MFYEKDLITDDGIKVRYFIKKGEPARPALFFVHGVGGNSTAWNEVVSHFAGSGHTIIKIDLRGHGKSDMPMDRRYYSINKIRNDIDKVLIQESVDEVIFIAHSFGGVAVLNYLINGGARCIGTVLCNVPHTAPYNFYGYNIITRFANRIAQALLQLLFQLLAGIISFRRRNYPYPDYSKLKHLSETRLVFHDFSAAPVRVFLYNYLMLSDCEQDKSALQNLRLPFLLITADRDRFLPSKSVINLSTLVNTWRLVVIEDCDHETIFRRADEVAGEIKQFITYLGLPLTQSGC